MRQVVSREPDRRKTKRKEKKPTDRSPWALCFLRWLSRAPYAVAEAASGLYFRLTGFTTRPLRMALVLTLVRTIWPSITARTRWMFGRNLRAVMPVTFVPTPPRYLALPRWVIWLPKLVFLPVMAQTRGMSVILDFQSKFGRRIVV